VPVTLVGSKKQGSDGWVERTRRFSASKCPKRYGSSRSIGIKLAQVCIFLQVVAVCVRARFLAQACNPKATRCPRRHGSNPSTPSAPWHRSLVLHGRPLTRRDGHLAHLTSCVCCSPAATRRHPPPTTTRPPLHHLPSLAASDPTASKSRTPRLQFPAHYLLPTLRKDWRAHCRQLPGAATPPRPPVDAHLPPVAAASPARHHHLARPSKTRFLAVAAGSPPRRLRLARRSRRLPPPSTTAGDGHSVAFCDPAAGICYPPAAAANVRKTSRGGRGGRRRRGAAREEGTEGRVGCGRAMALGVEQQQHGAEGAASSWSTMNAKDAIQLLRIMIVVSYQVACAINLMLSDQSSRRWSNKKRSMKHNFAIQKGREKEEKKRGT